MFSNPQQATIKILDEGLPLAYAHTIDFTGSGITGTASGSLVEEDVPGLFGVETDPLSLHLDQTTPQTFTGGDVTGSGLLKVTSGVLGLDETEYATPSDLGNYVPYAGATGDVDLGEYSLVNYVKMSWDEEIGAYLTF